MSQVYPLDSLIRRLDPGALPVHRNADEHLVIFDARARKVLPKEPLIKIGRDLRYYLVSTRRRPVQGTSPAYSLRSRTTGLVLDLEIRYEARCESGKQEQLVVALHSGEHPGAALDTLIGSWIEDAVDKAQHGHSDLCLDFYVVDQEICSSIAECARREAGLLLDVQLHPQNEPKLQSIPLKTGFFPIRTRDFDQEIEIKITTELEIDHANRMRALLRYRKSPSLEETVKDAVRQILAVEATLHTLCYAQSQIREILLSGLNSRLWEEGRRITFLRLESPFFGRLPDELHEIDHSVTCNIRDCRDITVQHQVQIILRDLGRFQSSGIVDLASWTRSKLSRFTQEILFEKSYIDLLLKFDPEDIKQRIQHEAEVVGCAVKQLIAIPDLEPLSWKDSFLLDKNDNVYVTQDSRVEVRLDIVVAGKITNLRDERLKNYLQPGNRLFADIRKMAQQVTQEVMHRIDPQRFYMNFQHSDNEEPPVREVLERHITAALVERFGIEDLSVTPKPLETDLTKRLSRLMEGPHSLEVICFPLNRGDGGERVTYQIDFDVRGVHPDGWYIFRAKNFPTFEEELSKIREVMARDVKAKLELAPRELRQFSRIAVQRQVEEVIHRSTQRKIIETFGLVVSVVNVTRGATLGEWKADEAVIDGITKSFAAGMLSTSHKLEELRDLYAQKSELLNGGVELGDSVVQALEDRIRGLESEMAPEQFARGHREVRALLPASSGESAAEEWRREALAAPTYRKQIAGAADGEPQ